MNEEQESEMTELLLELSFVWDINIEHYTRFNLGNIYLKGREITKLSIDAIQNILDMFTFKIYSIYYDSQLNQLIVEIGSI